MSQPRAPKPIAIPAPGDWAWRFVGEQPLARALVADLASLARAHGSTLVKHNRVRTVLRVERDGQVAFVKHYHPRGLKEWLKAWLRGGRAQREARSLRLLMDGELPVPELLAWASAADGHGGLITRDIGPAEELADAVPRLAEAPRAEVLALLRALASLIARLHGLGAVHHDLHAGNVLVTADGGLALLDFHQLSRPWFPARGRREDLAQILRSLEACLTRTRRLAFLKTYLAVRGAPGALRRLWTAVQRAERRQHRVRLRSRTRRCLLRSTRYTVERRGSLRIWRQRVVDREAVLTAIEAHRSGAGERFKQSRRTGVSLQPAPFAPEGVVVKQCESTWAEKLQALFYRGRARQAWVAALGLEVRGLETPEAFALVEEWRWGSLRRAWLLTRFVDAPKLDAFLAARLPELDPRAAHALMRRLGAEIGKLHARGIYHRDLKPPNVLVLETPAGPVCSFLDLDDTFFWRRLHWRRRVRNLAQLDEALRWVGVRLRRTLLRRFFHAYQRCQPAGDGRERRLWEAVARASVARAERRRLKKAPRG